MDSQLPFQHPFDDLTYIDPAMLAMPEIAPPFRRVSCSMRLAVANRHPQPQIQWTRHGENIAAQKTRSTSKPRRSRKLKRRTSLKYNQLRRNPYPAAFPTKPFSEPVFQAALPILNPLHVPEIQSFKTTSLEIMPTEWYDIDPWSEVEVPIEPMVTDSEIEEVKIIMELMQDLEENSVRGTDDAENDPCSTRS